MTKNLHQQSNTYEDTIHEYNQHASRREIAQWIHSFWTNDGSDESGIAGPLFDGRVDALGYFLMNTLPDNYYNDDENENEDKDDNRANLDIKINPVPRYNERDLTYTQFFHQFMSRNKPVIIKGMTHDWPANTKWTTTSNATSNRLFDNTHEMLVPNLKYLSQTFPTDSLSIHIQCSDGFKGSSHYPRRKQIMAFPEFASWWFHHHQHQQEEQEQQNNEWDDNASNNDTNTLYYLKDWKFVSHHPHYTAYTNPIYFQDDWLNNNNSTSSRTYNQYKFCYLGPKGTITPLHADVLNSYSWSSNVCGRKRWYLIPPNYTHLLYNVFGRKLASHLHADIYDFSNSSKLGKVLYPGLEKVRNYMIEIIQEPGETLFVPSGWHHTVENLEATLSINHNWINGTNILWSWNKVRRELRLEEEKRKFNMVDCTTTSSSSLVNNVNGSENPTIIDTTIASPTTECKNNDDISILWQLISCKATSLLNNEMKSGSVQDEIVEKQQDKEKTTIHATTTNDNNNSTPPMITEQYMRQHDIEKILQILGDILDLYKVHPKAIIMDVDSSLDINDVYKLYSKLQECQK